MFIKSEYATLFHIIGGPQWPLLGDKQRFPDSSFSASTSSEGHSASDARSSSGSSWCAPVSNDKHYLQVDLGRRYSLYYAVTYGDSNSLRWVATYNLNYTDDLVNWKTGAGVRKNDITTISRMYSLNLLLRHLIIHDISFTIFPCRYFKETKMLTIVQLGNFFLLQQELYDSSH